MTKPLRLVFCPYLPLTHQLDIGPWRLAPLPAFKGEWAPNLEAIAREFLAGFRDASGKALRCPPVLISHKVRGIDGCAPSRSQWKALQQTLDFAVLEGNPQWNPEVDGSLVATTDNSEIHVWPLDPARKTVAISRGAMVRALVGGIKIDSTLNIQAPLELPAPFSFQFSDTTFLPVLYSVLARQLTATHRRISVVLDWLSKAWKNTTSIHVEDRIVMLKTGFEALTNASHSPTSAKVLRGLFETTNAKEYEVNHLLWSPKEKPRRTRTWNGKSQQLTDLEHWFMTFADARNSIIHDGIVPRLFYRAKQSAYSGPMFHVAERLLREAIRIEVSKIRGRRWMLTPDGRNQRRLGELWRMLAAASR